MKYEYPPARLEALKKRLEAMGVKVIEPDEASRVYRVRAGKAVHEWLSSMTAEERGAMLETAHAASVPAVSSVSPVSAETKSRRKSGSRK